MAMVWRKSIMFFCIARILLGTLIPGVWVQPARLVQGGFAVAAVARNPDR
jgi:hypothetical protein